MIKEKILNRLKDVMILQESDGVYTLFIKYCIVKTPHGFSVSSKVSHTSHVFGTLRNATIWCIADNRNKIYAANRIRYLDSKLGSIDGDISVLEHLIRRNKKTDDKLIFLTKLSEALNQKNNLTDELNGYAVAANSWQSSQFRKPNIL